MLIEAWEPIRGGGQVHVLELTKALAASHNCKIDIFTMQLDASPPKTELAPGVRVLRVGKRRNFFSYIDRILWIPSVLWAVFQTHKVTPYTLIHAQANLPGIPGKILRWLLDIPVVYTVHGTNLLDLKVKSLSGWMERWLTTGIRYDGEITVSQKFLAYPNINQPTFIPNGVAVELFSLMTPKLRQNRRASPLQLLFVGRLDYVKGVDVLLEAIKELSQDATLPPFTLTLVGYGYEEPALRKLAQGLGIEPWVTFAGKLTGEALLTAYAQAHLFILPSRSEGFPLTLLEAWAAGLPIVATAVGEIPSLVEPEKNGFLANPQSVSSLVATLKQALRSPKLAAMGTRGQQLVAAHYTWQHVARLTYKLYTDVSH